MLRRFRRRPRSLVPASRTERWLRGVALAGWVGSGLAAQAGALEWPVATLLTGLFSAPLLVHSTFTEDDE